MALRVLVADDSAVARLALVRRVRAAGCEVVEGDSLRGALLVDATTLACALLDLDLGDGWGTDVAERLRAASAGLPVAFFTGGAPADALDRARALGPVFAKPEELDGAVAWVLAAARGR